MSEIPSLLLRTLLLSTTACLLLAGCKGSASASGATYAASSSASGGAGDGAALSGPPVYAPQWGARAARVCAPVMSPPTAAQASALVQCHDEYNTRDFLFLRQEVSVRVGRSRPVAYADGMEDGIDNRGLVYELSGSQTNYGCAAVNDVMNNAGKNCLVTPSHPGDGKCWMVHDGSYHCTLGTWVGPDARAATLRDQPGPTTY